MKLHALTLVARCYALLLPCIYHVLLWHTQLTAANTEKIASSRIEEGRLTIVFRDYELNQIALSNVRNKQDLWRCCNILDKITSLPFHTQTVMGTCITPPNSLRQLSQSMSGSTKRKPQLNL